MIMIKILKIFFLAITFFYASIGRADYYEVINVEKNDALNLRVKPDSNAERVTVKIPHDAKHILFYGEQKKRKLSVWYKIRFNGADGWVNSRYLRKRKIKKPKLLDKLACLGTEPSWILKRNMKTMRFSLYSDPKKEFVVKSIKTSINHGNQWMISAQNSSDNTLLDVAVTESNQCGDDMSDYIYRYDVKVSIGDNYLTGCCNRIGGHE